MKEILQKRAAQAFMALGGIGLLSGGILVFLKMKTQGILAIVGGVLLLLVGIGISMGQKPKTVLDISKMPDGYVPKDIYERYERERALIVPVNPGTEPPQFLPMTDAQQAEFTRLNVLSKEGKMAGQTSLTNPQMAAAEAYVESFRNPAFSAWVKRTMDDNARVERERTELFDRLLRIPFGPLLNPIRVYSG